MNFLVLTFLLAARLMNGSPQSGSLVPGNNNAGYRMFAVNFNNRVQVGLPDRDSSQPIALRSHVRSRRHQPGARPLGMMRSQ
jgi:hypothetical protein